MRHGSFTAPAPHPDQASRVCVEIHNGLKGIMGKTIDLISIGSRVLGR
jgi:hypothetical protein